MPSGLQHFHQSGKPHFHTFSSYHRQPNSRSPEVCDPFVHYALREIGIVEIESEWTARDRGTRTRARPELVEGLASKERARTWGTRPAPLKFYFFFFGDFGAE